MVFYGIWIFFFGIAYLIVGVEVCTHDYPGIGFITRTFIQAWRNSIGDMAPPMYYALLDETGMNIQTDNILLVWIVWIITFCNQFFALIILLNFLIAILCQSNDEAMKNFELQKYTSRADFNREHKLNSIFNDQKCNN